MSEVSEDTGKGGIITSLREFESYSRTTHFPTWPCFRGHCESSWNLMANLNRQALASKISLSEISALERVIISDFEIALKREKLSSHINKVLKEKSDKTREWIITGQYQHVGLATRFLDWSYRWDVGLFFALYDPKKEHCEKEGVVWIYRINSGSIYNDESVINLSHYSMPFDIFFKPSIYMNRFFKSHIGLNNESKQMGLFWIQSHDKSFEFMENIPLYQHSLEQWIIKAEDKNRLLLEMVEWQKIPPHEDMDRRIECLSKIYLEKGEKVELVKSIAEDINHQHLKNQKH